MSQLWQFARQLVLTGGLVAALASIASGQGGYGSGGGAGGGTGGGGFGGSMGGSGSGSLASLGVTNIALPSFSSGSMSGLGTGISSTGGTRSIRSGSSNGSTTISTTNPFASYYVNPLSMGLGTTTTGSGGFTQPLYGNTSTTSSYGGTASLSGSGVNSTTAAGGTSIGMTRQMYGVNLGTPAPSPGGLVQARSDFQNVIARSSSLPSKGGIRVLMDGEVVVLQGTVQDEHERRLAEALVRLTPGVRELRNELTPRQ